MSSMMVRRREGDVPADASEVLPDVSLEGDELLADTPLRCLDLRPERMPEVDDCRDDFPLLVAVDGHRTQ